MSDAWDCECGLSDCVYCLTRRAETAEAFIAQLQARIRELEAALKWVHKLSRDALFERTHRAACKAALDALSEINHKLAAFK